MAAGFDLEKYLRNSKAVSVDDLAWGQVPSFPLTEGEVRFLQYMMNIEDHTIVYLRELLSTKVIEDAEVTAFLSCWAYEEYFHGAALQRFLEAYVGPGVVSKDAGYRLRQSSAVGRAVKKLVAPLVSAATPDFAAVHMTWGAAQECTTLHGYEALARQSRHPVLKELMARIVKDERRHFAFYYNQAEKRLGRSPRMQRITRLAMDRLWRPVGVGAMPASESDFAAWYLFRDAQGQADLQAIDGTMAQLPGMKGWSGLSHQTNAAIARVAARGAGEAHQALTVRPAAVLAT
ncbi:MAG TPA: acyl-ACP desaturase [Candidatus Thermoplasmatota archaeon]|nr:acyl-ACP desaturase [Candidatus Thermoplasmatota archaeon]